MKREKNKNKQAFSLVELLTTLAVIGILLALLIPALNQVGKTASKVKQKAQFHAIEIGLEAFYSDTGDYPRSDWATEFMSPSGVYTSSHRLAEAMVGRDGLGYHYKSGMRINTGSYDYYADPFDKSQRRGPYLELETANAVTISNIWGLTADSLYNSYVLVDTYKQVKHLTTGKQIGMPILYYRADTSKGKHNASDPVNSTYNVNNVMRPPGYSAGNASIVEVNVPFAAGMIHPMAGAGGKAWFYERTTNPNFTTTDAERPYRAESFILHSAGPDGLYGNTDDIFNFEEEN